MTRKLLLLFAHSSQRRSGVNRPMFELVRRILGITGIDLHAEYPNLIIDVQREQQRLLAHDLILFQFPLYGYSTPAILKEWQNLVLEHGFAHGADGHAQQSPGALPTRGGV